MAKSRRASQLIIILGSIRFSKSASLLSSELPWESMLKDL